ncbi:SAM-dependent methyltransferase [Paenibacillus aceris]|uniref:23S rRNA (Cytidine2498-2'-O)-methyltransferase n=1 Tax=Paenibacillus aceris TaxID=869555 RepID=A0ABS4HT30_9BACL|nr:SAM-dependent methyltransferase [Paenibacillus aceris]MBP1961773.1 23S rRNA (cytidine2498-2'-O)-methyltransferase [Paenibacillus aceris]NHW34370.1 methyltransferase domain-containing protein [Paenibacillus aceris]
MTQITTYIGTSNHGFAQYAQDEIRKLFPLTKFTLLVPTEVFLFEVPEGTEDAITTIKEQEPIFLRHIQPVLQDWEITGTEVDLEHLKSWLNNAYAAGLLHSGEKIAIQVRKEERADVPYAPFSVKAALDEILVSEIHAEPVVRYADQIISIYINAKKLFVGLSKPADNLSDWSGGAIRFMKEEDQISRAKFKLLEAEQRFGIDFSIARTALDIGAAPGGWTSLLLERGLQVTAIDPAAMSPRLLGNSSLKIYKKNASDVKLRDNEFDLLVCDMSWDPRQMGRLVADLLYSLQSGGTAIITVKLMHKKPFQTVRDILRILEPSLFLLKAKQLFHNREELTLYLQKM